MTIGGMKMDDKAPLTEGVYYILLALYEPRHGYGIMQYVSELSKGRVHLGPGTVYGAIKSLLKRNWIAPLQGEGRKKEYVITEEGKRAVEAEIARLSELYHNGLLITGGGNKQ